MSTLHYIRDKNIKKKLPTYYKMNYYIEDNLEFMKKNMNINISSKFYEYKIDMLLDTFKYSKLYGYLYDINNRPVCGILISIYKIENNKCITICDTITDSMGMFQLILSTSVNLSNIRIKISDGQKIY